jgi:mannose-1-phosphate guanylyltransferase
MDHTYAVIMAGGSGTRFWPLSREARPKQFLSIGGGGTLIAQTFERLLGVADPSRILVVAGRAHRDAILSALPGLRTENLICEPCARNTAPAIGLAAVHIHARDPEAVMAVLPADHHIGDTAAFHTVLGAAFSAASSGSIITLGITPSRPETGYGYICKGASLGEVGGSEIFGVEAFVEKPDRNRALDYVMSGRYLWNSGMFIFRTDGILAEFQRHLPDVYAQLKTIGGAIGTPGLDGVLETAFKAMPSISIDYGIMEKVGGIRLIPATIAWSDVGSWASLPEVSAVDENGNVVSGDTVVVESSGCVIENGAQLVAAVGLRDTAVIATRDAVLVCPLDRTQDVKKVVDQLKAKGRRELL